MTPATTRWAALALAALSFGFGLVAATSASAEPPLDRRLAAGSEAPESARDVEDMALLTRFYRGRGLAMLWVAGEQATPRARALAATLRAADGDGLVPADYGAEAIDALLGASRPDLLADLEARLSLGLIRYVADLGAGRLQPHRVDPELFIAPEPVDRGLVLAQAAEASDIGAFVASFRPDQDEYRRLQAALADHRRLRAEQGEWGTVPDGPTLDPGMRDPRVRALRYRLRQSGDLARDAAAAGGEAELFDDALARAVERFQGRHGLDPDRRVGAGTRAALNVTLEERIRQLILNLERRRWMPDGRGERYVLVNLADFELEVVDGADTLHAARVVVGAPYHRTPVFSADMTYVVFNPYWHVPPSIATQELLPKIQEDPGYLKARNFDLLSGWDEDAEVLDPWSIDWAKVTPDSFPYKLRQGPGNGNALGRIKFMLPNQFNVYLHDTPAKNLFEKAERSFSHGCIRVAHPDQFGAIVLARTDGWDLAAVQAAINAEERRIVTLSEPLPVHITYLTAFVDQDGRVHFRNDVYGRDAILAEALLGPRSH